MEEKIAQLEAEVARLKGLLGEAPRRAKIEQMSSEVKDSNPYSRLMGNLLHTEAMFMYFSTEANGHC